MPSLKYLSLSKDEKTHLISINNKDERHVITVYSKLVHKDKLSEHT